MVTVVNSGNYSSTLEGIKTKIQDTCTTKKETEVRQRIKKKVRKLRKAMKVTKVAVS